MISINENKLNSLHRHFLSELDEQFFESHANLTAVYNFVNNASFKNYVEILLDAGTELVTGSVSDLNDIVEKLDDEFKINIKDPDQKELRDLILEALDYETLRKDFYPRYFQKLGIKSCVYCNSQLCITAEDLNGKLVGKYQVDHHLAKDTYPGLSICLCNLVPVCASCNVKKSTKSIAFELYTSDKGKQTSKYKFEIPNDKPTIAKYLTNRDASVIKIKFNEPTRVPGKNQLDDVFAITGIYETQIDVIEDIILKAHIYDDTFKKSLLTNFPGLFKNDMNVLNQLLLGNYIEEEQIHNRPLAKFMQDIAKQVGLIK